VSTRSTSSVDDRWVGAPPIPAPMSTALAWLRMVSPAAVRSGTSRRNQDSTNATSATGTAVRNSGCSETL
jgi:hypothetical protein